MMKYCCTFLKIAVEHKEIVYDNVAGCFWFYVWAGYVPKALRGTSEYTLATLKYCPYCGTKLPDDLTDTVTGPYDTCLAEAVGRWPITEKDVPEEFKSDKWWKKRRLDDPKILEEWRKKHKV